VSEALRTGDIGGVQVSTSAAQDKIMFEAVLSPQPAMLVVVISNSDASGYSNLLCHADLEKHWAFEKQTIDKVTIHLGSTPQIANITNWREAVGA
jgi:hypothetical protein